MCGEMCLVVLHDSGVTMWWLSDDLIPSPRESTLNLVWKDLPGVLSIEGSRDEYFVEVVCYEADKVVLIFRPEEAETKGGSVIVFSVNRQQDLEYRMSVVISKTDEMYCGSICSDKLFMFISYQLTIHAIERSKIIYKLDMKELTYLSVPTHVLGNDCTAIVLDSGNTLHLINWNQKRQFETVDPWLQELEEISNISSSYPNKFPVKTVELYKPITAVSFYPCDNITVSNFLILTSHIEDVETSYILFDLSNDTPLSTITLTDPLLLLGSLPFPCGVTSDHVFFVVPELNTDDILYKLMMFRSAEVASSLSYLNGKPTDAISHSSLDDALAYQQIESVNFCLNRVLVSNNGVEEMVETCENLVKRCGDGSNFSKQVAVEGAKFIGQAVELDQSFTALPHFMSQMRDILFNDDPVCSSAYTNISEATDASDLDDLLPESWNEHMSTKDIIKDAILSGDVALGEFYFTVQRQSSVENLDTFDFYVNEILIDLLKNEQVDQARSVMSNMMMEGNRKLKEICVQTDDIALCTYLISELPSNLLTKDEIEGERFLRQMNQNVNNFNQPVIMLTKASNKISLQLNWVIGWGRSVQELLLYEQHCIYEDDDCKQFSSNTELQFQIWRDSKFVSECDFELLADCYMADRYFFVPTNNQFIIQNRMITEGHVECSLNEYIDAFLEKNGSLITIDRQKFLQELLEKSLEHQLYTFIILHLILDRHSGLRINSPVFHLTESYLTLMSQANQENIYNCLYLTMERITGVGASMSQKNPLSVVALLLYSPNRAKENLENDALSWCDPVLLKESLTSYPRLKNVLFPEASEESPAPSISMVLEAFDDWKKFGLSYPSFLSFTDVELTSKYGRKTSADYSFYLSMGRPFYAYMSIMNNADLIKDEFVREIYHSALEHVTDHAYVGSSVIVTELLNRDCTEIVVDVQIMRLICCNKYFDPPEDNDTIRTWLSEGKIDQILPILSEALRSRGGLPRFEGQLLLHLFCKRGSLDIVCQHDNWLDLVWNLHAWQVEKVQAEEIIKKCTPSLRAHMKQVFYRMEEKTYGALGRPKYQDCCGLFGKIASCIGQDNVAERLQVLSRDAPVAIVMSYSFKCISRETAIVTWIEATLGIEFSDDKKLASILPCIVGHQLPILFKAFQIFYSQSKLLPFLKLAVSLGKGVIPEKLPPNCLKYFDCWSDEVLPDIKKVKEFLVLVFGNILTSAKTNFEQFFIVRYLSDYPFHQYLDLPDYFRLSLLREVLQGARLNLRLHHEDPEVIMFTKTEIHRTISTTVYEEEAAKVLEQMISKEHYDLARKFAQIAGFNTAEAIFNQIKNQLNRFKKSNLWKNQQSRLNFWIIVANRFELFQTELAGMGPIIRAKFYLLEGCNQELSDIERSFLISQGISAILTCSPPSVGLAQADRLCRFYWTTVANAYLNKELPEATYFNPLASIQDWELIDVPKRASDYKFPDYQFEVDEEVEGKIGEFISQFLKRGSLHRANRLCTLFNLKNEDLDIVKMCLDIAEEYITMQTLPESFKSLITDRSLSVMSQSTVIVTSETDNQHPIEEWSYKRKGQARTNSTRSTYSHSNEDSTWQTTNRRQTARRSKDWAAVDEIYVGDLLGTYVKAGQGLCEMFSTFYKICKEQGMIFRHSHPPKKHLELLVKHRASVNVMKQYVAFRNLTNKDVTTFIVKIIKSWMPAPTFDKDLPFEEFKKLADLVSDHISLATLIWEDIIPKSAMENVLRFLLFTHHCYTRGNYTSGRLMVLEFCKAKAHKFAQAGFCAQLVDMFFEAEQFNDMLYICDLIYSHNQFNLFTRHPNASKKPHFQSALLAYLFQNHPHDEASREAICLEFNKHLEIAKLYHQRAQVMVSDRTASAERLEECVKKFSKAARFYKLEQAYDKQIECTKLARLVSLQICFRKQNPNLNILNLSSDQVRNFLFRHYSFFEAYIVAQAYNFNDMTPYVFTMAVKEENMDYFEDYRVIHFIGPTFFESICVHAQKARRLDETATKNLIVILSHCTDIKLRRSIAQKLSLPTNFL